MLMIEREQFKEQKFRATMEKLEQQGLAGMKIGKHKVPEPDIEVELWSTKNMHGKISSRLAFFVMFCNHCSQ